MMGTITTPESGFNFIFDEDRVYEPEKEPFYLHKSFQGAKTCDFIYLTDPQHRKKPDQLLIIEVKATVPRNKTDLEERLNDIEQKFVDSILAYVGALANRQNTQAQNLRPLFRTTPALQRKIGLFLIVTAADYDQVGIEAFTDKLRKKCRHLERAFSLEKTQFFVRETAQKYLPSWGIQFVEQ